MNDQQIMEDLLLHAKGVCDLYMHGTIESDTEKVHGAFDNALKDMLSMQSEIYQKMSAKGWYETNAVGKQQIKQVKQKYTAQGN